MLRITEAVTTDTLIKAEVRNLLDLSKADRTSPVKVGIDSSHVCSIPSDVHAAPLPSSVHRHVDQVHEQVPNGEDIVRHIEGRPVLNADAGLDGVNGSAMLHSCVALQHESMH